LVGGDDGRGDGRIRIRRVFRRGHGDRRGVDGNHNCMGNRMLYAVDNDYRKYCKTHNMQPPLVLECIHRFVVLRFRRTDNDRSIHHDDVLFYRIFQEVEIISIVCSCCLQDSSLNFVRIFPIQ